MAAAMRDVDVSPGDSAKVIQGKLRAAAKTHEVLDTGTDFSRMSRFFAAGLGRPGTRTIRVLIESVRGLRAAKRLGPPPARKTENGREIRRLRGALAKVWAATALAFVAARIASGSLRVAFSALGGFLTAIGTIFGVVTYTANSALRAVDNLPIPDRSAS